MASYSLIAHVKSGHQLRSPSDHTPLHDAHWPSKDPCSVNWPFKLMTFSNKKTIFNSASASLFLISFPSLRL
ncbi:Uncharacterized protein HZ326_16085 [Fusarium oxysporum f. sp. albedinis]|nr:Uncharacterized protein HZ326_16085 [Fusarium oxysporum f. sp. albedinis]